LYQKALHSHKRTSFSHCSCISLQMSPTFPQESSNSCEKALHSRNRPSFYQNYVSHMCLVHVVYTYVSRVYICVACIHMCLVYVSLFVSRVYPRSLSAPSRPPLCLSVLVHEINIVRTKRPVVLSYSFPHLHSHGNTRQHTAAHSNTRQHTATHCNTLRRTVTHYLIRSRTFICCGGCDL